MVVDAVFDAEHARRPRADDGHEGFFVEVAEEVGSDHFHVLLVQQCLHQLHLVALQNRLRFGLLPLVRGALHLSGKIVQDLAEEVGEFFFVFFEDGSQSHQNAKVLLTVQNCFPNVPLLLLEQVAVLFDCLNAALFADCCEG